MKGDISLVYFQQYKKKAKAKGNKKCHTETMRVKKSRYNSRAHFFFSSNLCAREMSADSGGMGKAPGTLAGEPASMLSNGCNGHNEIVSCGKKRTRIDEEPETNPTLPNEAVQDFLEPGDAPGVTLEQNVVEHEEAVGAKQEKELGASLCKAYVHVTGRGYPVLPPQDQLEDNLEVRIGAKCTAYDNRDKMWYKSSIVELHGARAKIHYEGWDKKYDSIVEISSLKPSVKKAELPVMATPLSLVVTDIFSKSVRLEVGMPADAQKVQEFFVNVNGLEDPQKIKVFTASSSSGDACCRYAFEYKGLDADTEYELQVRAAARTCKKSAHSPVVPFKTAAASLAQASAQVEDGASRAAKAKAQEKTKLQMQKGGLKRPELSEEEIKRRDERRKTMYNDDHCSTCLGWTGAKIYCSGGCMRTFHIECVNLDDAEEEVSLSHSLTLSPSLSLSRSRTPSLSLSLSHSLSLSRGERRRSPALPLQEHVFHTSLSRH
jgi:hypothetical protein